MPKPPAPDWRETEFALTDVHWHYLNVEFEPA
jgi:hypothetical protein